MPRACCSSTNVRPCTPPLLRIACMRMASLPLFDLSPTMGSERAADAAVGWRCAFRGEEEIASTDLDFGRLGDVAMMGTADTGRGFLKGSRLGVLPRRLIGLASGRAALARTLKGSSFAERLPLALRARVGDGRTGRSSSSSKSPFHSSSVGEGGTSASHFLAPSLAAAKMLWRELILRGESDSPARDAGAGDGSPIWTSLGDAGTLGANMVRAREMGARVGRFSLAVIVTCSGCSGESSSDNAEMSVPLPNPESALVEPLTAVASVLAGKSGPCSAAGCMIGVFDRGASLGDPLGRLGCFFMASLTRFWTSFSNSACR